MYIGVLEPDMLFDSGGDKTSCGVCGGTKTGSGMGATNLPFVGEFRDLDSLRICVVRLVEACRREYGGGSSV